MEAQDHCAAILRDRDRDRYAADLFAPEAVRRHLFALHAFDTEVARIGEVVREPALGEIRLRWWHDALTTSQGQGHPIAAALLEAIDTFSLPLAAFEMLLDARAVDLYEEALPTLEDLEAYAGQIASSILELTVSILAAEVGDDCAAAAGHGGVAQTLTRVMLALPAHTARGQSYLPADLAAAHGVDRASLREGRQTPAMRAMLAELRSIARSHLEKAERAIADLPAAARPAFLPLALVGPYLDRMDRPGYDPLSGRALLAPWRRQWIIWRAGRRG